MDKQRTQLILFGLLIYNNRSQYMWHNPKCNLIWIYFVLTMYGYVGKIGCDYCYTIMMTHEI